MWGSIRGMRNSHTWGVVGVPIEVEMVWADGKGEPDHLSTAPTATVQDGKPASYSAAQSKTAITVAGSSSEGWTATIPAASNPQSKRIGDVGSFMVEWSHSGGVVATTVVYRVDRRFATLAYIKNRADINSEFTADEEAEALELVEAELTTMLSMDSVPELPPAVRLVRHYEERWITAQSRVEHPDLMVIEWCNRFGRNTTIVSAATAHQAVDGSMTEHDDIEVVLDNGVLRRTDGEVWDAGVWRFGVVTGFTQTFDDLANAMARRYRHFLTEPRSAVPSRATSFTSEGGATYRLSMPNARSTGDPEVDAVYRRYNTLGRAATSLGLGTRR